MDDVLMKTGTISSHDDAYNIRSMKYSVSPVVRVAVKPKNLAELPKLISGMKRLSKSDPLVLCINDAETGENIVCGSGELHVEICINDLINEFAQIEIIKTDPIVSYRETVRALSSQPAMSKSANAHNRLYCTAEPLTEAFCIDVEDGMVPLRDKKLQMKYLSSDKHNWSKEDAGKIWGFGPNTDGPNVLLDISKGIQYMHEIKEHMISGFEQVTKKGVLCEENMRGVRFNVVDATLHNDSIHRGGGQISPATRRVLYATELLARPTLQEPIFLVEITAPQGVVGNIYEVMMHRRGQVDEEVQIEGTPLVIMKAFLPVSESFGFTAFLREKTGGKAFPNCVFHHWETMEGDALDPNNKLCKMILDIRKRKGMKEEVPNVSKYMDKL
jgi:elongation factor 2